MDLQKMGRFIAECRKSKQLTQSQLGETLGISGKAISKWERGISAPDISILKDLSKTLGISISELINGERIPEEVNNEKRNEIILTNIGKYQKLFKKRYTKIIFILLSIFILTITTFSIVYLINNYNKCFVYKLSSANKDFYLEGLIASNQKENSLIITGIENNNELVDNIIINTVEIELIINNKTIYNSIHNYYSKRLGEELLKSGIIVNENPTINRFIFNNKNSIIIKISYIDRDNNQNEITIPLRVEKKFSNNRLFYK